MNPIIMYGSALIAVSIVIYMLIKQMDIKITMFLMGIVLMFVGIAAGNGIAVKDFVGTGAVWLDPLLAITQQFQQTLTSAGFIILILGGYSAYMTAIGANDVTVSVITKPVSKIKSAYVLVPIVFLLGNLLSLVIPSASNLAIILLATLYPVMRKAGMSKLTAAAVIATTATVMPTPLGGDNVAISQELAKYPEYLGLTVTDYVFQYHAIISIPTILLMAIVHYFWQKFMDKRSKTKDTDEVEVQEIKAIEGGALYKTVYALLPIFPIILLIVTYCLKTFADININVNVEVATMFSFAIAILCDVIKRKSGKEALQQTEHFFKGMGGAMPIVALLVAATIFVTGLKSIGLIEALQDAMMNIQGSGLGFVLPLILVLLTALIVLLSGSGTALFFAMVPLMVALSTAAGISAIAVSIPMGLAGNLLRAVSPVSAVVLIVAGSVKVSPLDIVRRTSVPMITGVVFMFVLSMILFL
ncbi:C4-dicarboxylate transporter DcuC [Paenibacillus arenosi]|uniref:C4-dicarboxylate transporter DcuC n=1 Tax=Paenibacillus arenosi TaxID=2774142 RepID=A0ABR9B1Y5_9BACL|nr:C4-dicarboxylate transporter DcuC [Paenibacillus arenosi]MBD8500387.1 C4-dicarboxylate transporter DcuC [Paenibacillus arenosi]